MSSNRIINCFTIYLLLQLQLLSLTEAFIEQVKFAPNSLKDKRCAKTVVYGGALTSKNYFTTEDIENYAKYSGLRIESKPNGPFLRLEAFPVDSSESIGYLTAFMRPVPLGLLQLETIQVENRRQKLGFQRQEWTIDGPGISFIMGSYALCWAYENGCRTSQLLAVNDSPTMHEILKRLYAR
jgi:hypothetical protein